VLRLGGFPILWLFVIRLEVPKLVVQVGFAKILVQVQVSLAVIGIPVGVLVDEIAVLVFFASLKSITINVVIPRADADTPAMSPILTMLGEQ
jgi:hypothetical protein